MACVQAPTITKLIHIDGRSYLGEIVEADVQGVQGYFVDTTITHNESTAYVRTKSFFSANQIAEVCYRHDA